MWVVTPFGTYNSLGQLTQVIEQPSGDITTYNYSTVGNLLTEVRSSARPYSRTYTYDTSGKRKTAVVVTNGVTTHNGTYTYDGAGRLTTVVDTATNTTENYVWNSDGNLASSYSFALSVKSTLLPSKQGRFHCDFSKYASYMAGVKSPVA